MVGQANGFSEPVVVTKAICEWFKVSTVASLLWSNGDKHIPCDYRLYAKEVDGATKNDHFRAMLAAAKERGFQPKCVAVG